MSYKLWSVGCSCCKQSCGCRICNNTTPNSDLVLNFNPVTTSNVSNIDLTHINTNNWSGTTSNFIFNYNCLSNILSWGSSPGNNFNFISKIVDPFQVNYNNNNLPSLQGGTGILTITAGNHTPTDGYCVNLCALGCGSGIDDTKIVVSNDSVVASGYTGPGGCVSLDIGGPGFYNIEIDPPNYESLFTSGTLICPNTYIFPFGCSFEVCTLGCLGNSVSGIDIQVKDNTTGDIVFETVSASSCVTSPCLPLVGSHSFSAIANIDGQSQTKSISCGVPVTFSFYDFCVFGCNGLPLEGAQVIYNGKTETTGENGCVDGFLIGPNQNTVVVKDQPRFSDFPVAGFKNGCDIFLSAVNNYICCTSNCSIPICFTLQLTDSVLGNCTLTLNGGYPGLEIGGVWGGYINYSFGGKCGCSAGDILVLYYFHCTGQINVWVVGTSNITPSCNCIVGQKVCPGVDIVNPLANSLVPIPFQGAWSVLSESCNPFEITFITNVIQCPRGCATCNFPPNSPCGCAFNGGVGAPSFGTPWGEFQTPVFITITDECP